MKMPGQAALMQKHFPEEIKYVTKLAHFKNSKKLIYGFIFENDRMAQSIFQSRCDSVRNQQIQDNQE
jgi:hypothetical protein